MNDQSSMCNQVTCASTLNAISSQESVGGHSHFNSLVGLPIDLYGRDLAHANHFHQQENISQKTTNVISGQPSSISSESAALTLSLGSRLQQRLEKVGSMEYQQTWSLKTTPAGRPYWAHTASQHRISDNVSIGLGLIGWATPCAKDERGNHSDCWAQVIKTTGKIMTVSNALMENRGGLNPAHSRWLMGFPKEWDYSGVTAMQSFRKSPKRS